MPNTDRRWLAGPVPDLLWGCGLAYMPILLVLVLAGPRLQALVPLGLLPLGSLLFAVPHYGATLLRVYERSEDRQKYRFFTVHLTILVWGFFAVGLFQPTVGSAIYSVFLTWSPWHYAGQNYGLASMFLRRRGVEVDLRTKRALHASFVLSFVLAFLAMHVGESTGAGYAPTSSSSIAAFRFYALGISLEAGMAIGALVLVAYIACLGMAAVGLLRRASLADIGPSALLILSQALWFTIPIVFRTVGVGEGTVAFGQSTAQYAFWWIIFAHSVQYLWVSRYFAQSAGAGRRYLLRAIFAGSALYGLPVLLLAMTDLSPVPYDAGLFLLVNAAVNLHHFVLDGAIWKLRDSSVARILLRPVESIPRVKLETPWVPWRRIAIVVVATLYIMLTVVHTGEIEFGVTRSYGDVDRLRIAEQRLAGIRLPSPLVSQILGAALASAGELPEAELALGRSIDQYPSALAWTALGQIRSFRQDWSGAAEALSQAIALEPNQLIALRELGHVQLASGNAAEAIAPLERALALSAGKDRGKLTRQLQRARSLAR